MKQACAYPSYAAQVVHMLNWQQQTKCSFGKDKQALSINDIRKSKGTYGAHLHGVLSVAARHPLRTRTKPAWYTCRKYPICKCKARGLPKPFPPVQVFHNWFRLKLVKIRALFCHVATTWYICVKKDDYGNSNKALPGLVRYRGKRFCAKCRRERCKSNATLVRFSQDTVAESARIR